MLVHKKSRQDPTDYLRGFFKRVTARKFSSLVAHGALQVSLLADRYC